MPIVNKCPLFTGVCFIKVPANETCPLDEVLQNVCVCYKGRNRHDYVYSLSRRKKADSIH